jgi:hypothetical protein
LCNPPTDLDSATDISSLSSSPPGPGIDVFNEIDIFENYFGGPSRRDLDVVDEADYMEARTSTRTGRTKRRGAWSVVRDFAESEVGVELAKGVGYTVGSFAAAAILKKLTRLDLPIP